MHILSYLKHRATALGIRQRLLRSFLAALSVIVLLQSLYVLNVHTRWKLKAERINDEHQTWLLSEEGNQCSLLRDQLNQKITDACRTSGRLYKRKCEVTVTETEDVKSVVDSSPCHLSLDISEATVRVVLQPRQDLVPFLTYYGKSFRQDHSNIFSQLVAMFALFLTISLVTRSLFFGSTLR